MTKECEIDINPNTKLENIVQLQTKDKKFNIKLDDNDGEDYWILHHYKTKDIKHDSPQTR